MKRKLISLFIFIISVAVLFIILLSIRNYYKVYGEPQSRYGSGKLSTKSYLVENTGCLQLHGTFRLNIIQSPQSMVTIKVDENLIPFIEVKNYSGCLLVQALPGFLIKPSQPMEVIIKTKKFNKLDAKGNIVFDARDLDSKNLILNLSGNSYGHIEGSAKNMIINATGSSSLHAINFKAQHTTIHASGSANLSVDSQESLLVKANGNVKVLYKGTPSLAKQISRSVKVLSWKNRKQDDTIQPTLIETIVGK
ncbi:DUF2807 domain-containing protein [Thiotrichales bacterium 19S3-7]|nr:DUF2807 domain-containing protein [Thiotrichales bacterium 19S3-7]MCF6802297.1 DUF2807 domain-containing protein [Thiotrichales bacterium 19S3-11]